MTKGDGQTMGEGVGVAPSERIFALDALRGFALAGIALVNVRGLIGVGVPAVGPADRLVESFVTFFVQGRFYPIFAFLFGVGFFIFMRNAESKGYAPRPLFARRLGALLLLGAPTSSCSPARRCSRTRCSGSCCCRSTGCAALSSWPSRRPPSPSAFG